MNGSDIEFGLDTFVPVTVDEAGHPVRGDIVIRNTVEEAVLAEAIGIDSFNIGEHYRPDFMDSAGHVILAAIAARTERIRLGTSVTVLSTQDPVRVYTDFATLDAVSNGRAQLIVGRGSATESFPLFGFDLADYETLFEEKLDLLTRLLRDQPVTWSGTARSPLADQYVSPPLPEGHLPTWVGVGGSPQSVIRAARYGLPLMLAIIGGHASRFAPHVELYQQALEEYGHPPMAIGVHSLGFVATSDEEAADTQFPHWMEIFESASRERGWARPTLGRFRAEITDGAPVRWIARDSRHQDGGDDPAAGAEPIRSGLRRRTGTARTADGDHRALRASGNPTGPGTARGSPASTSCLQSRRGGVARVRPRSRWGALRHGSMTRLAIRSPCSWNW